MQKILIIPIIIVITSFNLHSQTEDPRFRNSIGFSIHQSGIQLEYQRLLRNDFVFRSMANLVTDESLDLAGTIGVGIHKYFYSFNKFKLYAGIDFEAKRYRYKLESNSLLPTATKFSPEVHLFGGIEFNPNDRFSLFMEQNLLSHSKWISDQILYIDDARLRYLNGLSVGGRLRF